jgi:hypothetical protein
MGQNDGFLVWEMAQPGMTGDLALVWKKDREQRQPVVYRFAAERQNGNSD